MILKSLEITNFRQYLDEKILFSTDMDKSFTIIQGTTGAGKTKLMNAITWCLYGEELHRRSKKKGLPLYNTLKIDEIAQFESFKVKVEMEFLDEEDNTIIIKREKTFQKDNEGKISDSIDEPEEFKILRQDGKDYKPETAPVSFIDRTAPKDIEEYFFFDGERLDDYFDDKTGEKIKEAVFKIAQIDLFQKLIKHLNDRKNNLSKQYEAINPESGKYESKIREIEAQTIEKTKILNSTKDDFKIAEDNIEEIQEELRTTDSDKVKSLQAQRDKLNKEIKGLDSKIEELKGKRNDNLLKMCPKILTFPAIIKTKHLTKNASNAGYIPSNYKRNFLENLIKEGCCICGTDLEKNEECKKSVEKLLKETSPITDIENVINEQNLRLDTELKNIQGFRKKQVNIVKNLSELLKKRKKKDTDLFEISKQLENVDEDNVSELEISLNDNIKARDNALKRKALLEDEINKLNANKEHFERKRDKAKQDLEVKTDMELVLDFCRKSLKSAEEIQSILVDKIREDIEIQTAEQFAEIMWKEKTYTGVEITDKYEVIVNHISGEDAAPDLSSGEGQLLALSFMGALNSVSGFNLPIIIDTPLGRLDKDPKISIAENFPNYLKGKQVTLLVTSEEYTPAFRAKILSRVGKEYKIDFNETEKGSIARVIPYDS